MYDRLSAKQAKAGNEVGGGGPAPGKMAPTQRMAARGGGAPDVAAILGAPEPNACVEPKPGAAMAGLFGDDPYGMQFIGNEKMRVTTDVNVRSSPKVVGDNRVGGFHAGHEISVIAREGEWVVVMHDGQRAYVHGKFVEKAGAKPEKAKAKVEAEVKAAEQPARAPEQEKKAAAPQPVVDHSHEQIIAMAEQSGNPLAVVVAGELRTAKALYASVPKVDYEQHGPERAELVTMIKSIRSHIAQLKALPVIQAGFYRVVQDIAPNYHQANRDIITKDTYKHTCNITSLSMTLESLGKTAADYIGDPNHLLVAARTMKVKPEEFSGMRLPDFMQVAVVATVMTTEPDVMTAWRSGFGQLTDPELLKKLARQFRATATVVWHQDTTSLRAEGDAVVGHDAKGNPIHRRRAVLEMANQNRRSDDAKRHQELEKMHSPGVEQRLPLERYRTWVQTTVGGELGSGAAVIVGMGGNKGHFARLQAVHAGHIMLDDPGERVRADLKLTYEEARAMGCFLNRIVVRG